MPDWKKIEKAAREYGNKTRADILLFNGPVDRGYEYQLINLCRNRRRRPNVLLLLVTSGGSAHAAYRMGRCLQQKYQKVEIFVPGWCKSAGTLLAVAAHNLILGDFTELGPIDVQRAKPDDLWMSSSGLIEDAAIETLENSAWKMFEKFVREIKDLSSGQITFRMAAEAAAPLVVGAFAPIFSQIDPLKIGENSRAVKIANDYGVRLNVQSQNLRSHKSIENLVSGYSSHAFVIDRQEAEELFVNVSVPDNKLEQLCGLLESGAYIPLDDEDPNWRSFLNPEIRSSKRKPVVRRVKIHEAAEEGEREREGAGTSARTGTNDGGDSSDAAGAAAAGTQSNVEPLGRSGGRRR